MVDSGCSLVFFSSWTASIASPRISRLFCHSSGSSRVLEKTIFGTAPSASTPSVRDSAKPWKSR